MDPLEATLKATNTHLELDDTEFDEVPSDAAVKRRLDLMTAEAVALIKDALLYNRKANPGRALSHKISLSFTTSVAEPKAPPVGSTVVEVEVPKGSPIDQLDLCSAVDTWNVLQNVGRPTSIGIPPTAPEVRYGSAVVGRLHSFRVQGMGQLYAVLYLTETGIRLRSSIKFVAISDESYGFSLLGVKAVSV